MENKYYIYLHIRKNDCLPFYIGKGCGKRAYNIHGRSNLWKKFTKKYEYIVTFLKTNLSNEDAFKLEIEYIKLYGRRNKGNGSLLNLTDGGDGALFISDLVKNKISQSKKGIKLSEETKKKMSESNKGISRNKGIPHTKERILLRSIKTSNNKRGYKVSEETKKKISNKLKGTNLKQETKDKISKIHKGKKKKLSECPHCGITMSINHCKRYHFDKCKLYKI